MVSAIAYTVYPTLFICDEPQNLTWLGNVQNYLVAGKQWLKYNWPWKLIKKISEIEKI